MPDEGSERINISLPTRTLRAADMRATETKESRSGYIARLIREDLERRGLTLADPRFDPRRRRDGTPRHETEIREHQDPTPRA